MSFPQKITVERKIINHIQKPFRNLKKVVSLQVRKIPSRSTTIIIFVGKMSQSASLTIEMAFSGTLFLLCSLCLILPLHIIGVYEHIQETLETVAKEVTVEGYLSGTDNTKVLELINEELIKQRIILGLGQEWLAASIIKDGRQGLTFQREMIKAAEQEVCIILTYQINTPFLSFFRTGILVTQQTRRRMWTGMAGESLSNQEPELVYATAYGSVYHRSLSCRHLNVSVKAVGIESIESVRNENGARYYLCTICQKSSSGNNIVLFITHYGTRYHYTLECRELSVTVRSVPIGETSLPPCKRCG